MVKDRIDIFDFCDIFDGERGMEFIPKQMRRTSSFMHQFKSRFSEKNLSIARIQNQLDIIS